MTSRQSVVRVGRGLDLVEHPVDAAMTVKYWTKVNRLYGVVDSRHPTRCKYTQWNLGIRDTQGTMQNCSEAVLIISQVPFRVLNRIRGP